MKGLTIQERRVLVAILLALAIGALVRYWRRQGDGGGGQGGGVGYRAGAKPGQPEPNYPKAMPGKE